MNYDVVRRDIFNKLMCCSSELLNSCSYMHINMPVKVIANKLQID